MKPILLFTFLFLWAWGGWSSLGLSEGSTARLMEIHVSLKGIMKK